MNRAFLFDMNGVLVDSENMWIGEDRDVLVKTFGAKIADKIGSTMGVSIDTIYELGVSSSATIDKETYLREYDKRAAFIYARAPLIEGADKLAGHLIANGFRLGVVSASRKNWMARVLPRLSFHDKLEAVISINDESLASKPAPDGYLEALRRLDAGAERSIVLEDSNRGIESGKAAGCHVIGYRGHLVPGYEQTGADAYADTMDDVMRLVAGLPR